MLDDTIRAPGAWLMLLEARAPWEYVAMRAASPWLKVAPGDGHPVLVFPGLGANDLTTRPLRGFLRKRGYTTYPWEQGWNRGPRPGVVEAASARVQQLAERHGQRVSLVGWSLGGVYARELAKLHPEHVRCVVTLGTPFVGSPRSTNAWRVYELMSGMRVDGHAMTKTLHQPPACPTTSVYSRSDGIVAWQCSVNADAPHTENIEIAASHIGMGLNPLALYAVADRLAQDPQRWRRFDAGGWKRWFYKVC